jgi:hypothetical protein
MLCGSNSAKMEKLRLNKLSTFGLLSQLKQTEVVTLIDLLIANGCLDQEEIDRFRPVLRLTPLGGEVMRGKADVPPGLNVPRDLHVKLRDPRAGTAVAKQPTPPKAEERVPESGPHQTHEAPSADEQAREDAWIIGLGNPDYDEFEPRLETAGADSLREAELEPALRPTAFAAAPAPQVAELPPPLRPPYYWTWRLLSQGFLPDECLEIRGITRETLLDHVRQAAESGLEIRADWCTI